MLKPGWINRYSPPKALASASNANAVFDDVWAALFFITTATDLVFAVLATRVAWAWFAGVFPTASKIVLIVIQYAVTRAIVPPAHPHMDRVCSRRPVTAATYARAFTRCSPASRHPTRA